MEKIKIHQTIISCINIALNCFGQNSLQAKISTCFSLIQDSLPIVGGASL